MLPSADNNSQLQPTTIVSSSLADSMGSLAKLYYLVRMLDQQGSGWVTLHPDYAAHVLGVQPSTIRKNISLAKLRGYFYNVIWNRDKRSFSIRYKSDVKIAQQIGLENLGALVRVALYELPLLKFVATEAHAELMQNASIYHAKQELKRLKRRGPRKYANLRVQSIEDIFRLKLMTPTRQYPDKESRSALRDKVGVPVPQENPCAEQVEYRSERYLFVRQNFRLIGASQEGIGKSLGRSSRTVQRRLSNSYRKSRSLPKINKLQIAQNTGEGDRDWKAIRSFYHSEMDTQGVEYAQRRFNHKKQTYMAGCNLYYLNVELVRQKWKRFRLTEMTLDR